MTHIYIPKSSDMWCIHHYGSTEVNMHLDFLGPLRGGPVVGYRALQQWIDLPIKWVTIKRTDLYYQIQMKLVRANSVQKQLLALTVPSFVNPIDFNTHLYIHAYGYERVKISQEKFRVKCSGPTAI